MKILIKILNLLILIGYTLNSKSVSFGFESGNIILSIQNRSEISKENKSLNVKFNSFIKLHYMPLLDRNLTNELDKENINLKFNLNDYEITVQKINSWGREAEEFFKNLILEKYTKIIKSIKNINFTDKKIYLKNSFKIKYEIENELHEIIKFPEQFENYLFNEVFSKAFSHNVNSFSHRILLNLKDIKIRLNINNLIEKHDSGCKNAYQCRMALDYSVSKSKIIEFIFEEINNFLQKEFMENYNYSDDIPMESINYNKEVFLGFYIYNDKIYNSESNLKKKDLQKFFILYQSKNYNYYNTNQIWIIDSLIKFVESNKARKDDL